MPSVLIIDDNLLARQGLQYLLNQEYRDLVFGEAKTGEEAAVHLGSGAWDMVVIEISIPGEGGFHILQEIRKSDPVTRVLMLSRYSNPQYALQARQLKASGYAGKNSTRAQFLKAFQSVLQGKQHFMESRGARGARQRPVYPDLSSREQEILRACVAGKRLSEVAAQLDLSIKTVSTYKRRVLNKFRLESVADLVRYAIEHKLS